jgi:hypothetical protein
MNLLGTALAVDAGGTLQAFSVATDGHVWTAQQPSGGAWSTWSDAGRPAVALAGAVAATYDSRGALQVFAIGQDGNAYTVADGGDAWTTIDAPSGVRLGAVGTVADTAGVVWIAAAGSDGNVYASQQQPDGSWSAWASLGAPGTGVSPDGSLGLALDGSGAPVACAVALDGNLYVAFSSAGAWDAWTAVGAPATAPLVGNAAAAFALGSGGAGQIWACAVATDGNAWLTTQATTGGAWSSWSAVGSAGGGFVGQAPLGALVVGGGLVVGGAGGDGNVYVATQPAGAVWAPWVPVGSPLTLHQPMFSFSVVDLGDEGTLDLGDAIAVSLDGNSPWSLEVWLRLTSRSTNAPVVQKGSELSVSLRGLDQLAIELGSASTMEVPIALQLGRWHHVTLVFTPSGQGDGSGQMIAYLDGGPLGEPELLTGTAATSADWVVGGGLRGQVASLSLWSTALVASASKAIRPPWSPPTVSPALAASFWFADGAAFDLSGNGNVATLGGGAAIVRLAPALSLGGASHAAPGPLDVANPGSGSAPFSVTAWVHPATPNLLGDAKQPMVVLANGSPTAGDSLVCWLQFRDKPGDLVWTVRRGGVFGATVAATRKLRPGVWSHVAATYDGATLTVYVDGEASGSAASDPIPVRTAPAITIGAAPDGGTGHDFSSFFSGGLQAIGVWSQSLTAAQVAVAATTNPSGLIQPGLVAFYQLGLNQAPMDTISGVPVGLFQGAAIGDFPADLPAAPAAARLPPPRREARPPHITDLLGDRPPAREPRPVSKALPPEEIDALLAAYGTMLERLPVEQRPALADLFEQNLYRGIRLQAEAGRPTPGTVSHRRDGDQLVFEYHGVGGVDEIARVDAVMSQCTAWIIDIVATALGMIASVIGVGYSVVKVVDYLVARALQPVVSVFLQAAQDAVTLNLAGTDLVIKLVRTVYNAGLLTTVAAELLSGYSWWNIAFAIAGFLINLLALWVTGGWWLLYVLAQLAVSVAQFIVVVRSKPADCAPGPRLTGLSPASAVAGGAAFVLSVAGAGFQSGATVQWNDGGRATTFVSESRLTAQVLATDIASAGTARVAVINPGTDPSDSLRFTIT